MNPSSSTLYAFRDFSPEEIAMCLAADPWFTLPRSVAHAAQRMATATEINRRFALELAEVPDEFYSPQQVRKEAA